MVKGTLTKLSTSRKMANSDFKKKPPYAVVWFLVVEGTKTGREKSTKKVALDNSRTCDFFFKM